MDIDIQKLNKEQKEAVTFGKGPLLIVAGAGTGKTTVITQRIAYLIAKEGLKPEEILALTFTDKAAGEMEERIDKLLPYGYVDLWVSTFHSFCERVLKDYALDIGLPSDFKLLDQTAAWLLIRQNLDKFNLNYYKPLGNPTKFIHALISHFSRCKDQAIYPEDYLEFGDSLKTNLTDLPEDQEVERIKEVVSAYHIYQKLLLDNNLLDFGDLINYCLKLFQQRPAILERYRKQFKHILIDEFQDTNWSQYELAKMLATPRNNLTVCADDDQAIYRFRGASFNNIIQFKKDFPETKEVFLIQNYRSTQDILDLSYQFIIQNNPDRLEFVSKIDKKLIAAGKGEGSIEHLHFRSLEGEVQGVIKKIKETIEREKETNFGDFVILVRANDSANPFARALERAGFPYQFLASRGLYSKPIILDIISYFKLLDDYHESSAVYRILNFPFFGISDDDIMRITLYCRRKTKSIYETLQELPLVFGLAPGTTDKINFILSLIKKHTQLAREGLVSEVLVAFLEDSGYLKHLTKRENGQEIFLINQFYKKVKDFEESALDPKLKDFMEGFNLELESNEQGKLEFDPGQGPDMIRIMTVHAAKGLEFKYVFLANLVDKRFPTIERRDPIEIPEALIKEIVPEGDIHLQEERRLFYVAMTRAKQGLFLTSAEDYGGMRKKKLSRFLTEMGFGKEAQQTESVLPKKKEIKKSTAPSNAVVPQYFSFSQLAAFEKCPLQYKFAHILKIPIRGKAVFSFGKTMHNTLYAFVKMATQKEKIAQTNLFGFPEKEEKQPKSRMDIEGLLEMYNKNWIDEWYESKEQKDKYRQAGKKALKSFYDYFTNQQPEVLKIEEQVALEVPFKLKIKGNLLIGRIDRIDKLADGIEIIDYKTGSFKDKLSSDDKQQLLLYQIAAEEVLGLKSAKLSYHYLEEGEFTSFLGNETEKESQKEKILAQIEKIKKGEFNPTPGWQCGFCDFKDICDHAQK